MPRPPLAADARHGPKSGHGEARSENAYIINPGADRPMLTPGEALELILNLSAILVADERFRGELQARTVTP